MFKRIMHSWQIARADILRKEFGELLEAWVQLLQTDREEAQFIQISLKWCFDAFGTKEEILSLTKKEQKSIVKKVEKMMQKAPLGNAIGYAWFAKWLESFYLPGENAKLVHKKVDEILLNTYEIK